MFFLGLLVRAIPVLRGGGLNGDLGYDDGVYQSAAVALVHGLVPYRDFLFLQPPGLVLLLTPFAALGSLTSDGTGMALARVAFMVIGATNAVLVALLAGRVKPRAGLVAGVLYAMWYSAAGFEKTTLLVPPQTAPLLGSVWLLGNHLPVGGRLPAPRRSFVAGCLTGLALAIQLWAIIPLGVLTSYLVWHARPFTSGRLLTSLAFVAGAVATAGLVFVPFLLVSDGAMLRDLVLDQVGRPSLGVSIIQRLRNLEGLRNGGPIIPGAVVVGVAAAGLAVVAWATRRVPEVRIWTALFASQSIVLLAIPVFFPHYVAWAAAPAAIALGVGAAEIGTWMASLPRGRAYVRVAIALVLVALLVPGIPSAGTSLPFAQMTADVAAARCVATDEPTLLVELGLIGRNIARGCSVVLDPTGVSYDSDRGHLAPGPLGPSRVAAAGYQELMEAYYGGAGAALIMRRSSDGFDTDTWTTLRCLLPVGQQLGSILVLRTAGTSGAPCT